MISDRATLRVHFFPDTGSAYNAVQCRSDIKDGDILIVSDEQVIGLAYTWPVAVTTYTGHFHAVAEGKSLEADFTDVFTLEQIKIARALANAYRF